MEKNEEYCKKYYIASVSLFGSVLNSDFNTDSDVDVFVVFDVNHIPDFFFAC